MVNVYDSYKTGRIKVFLVIKNKEITSIITGNKAVVKEEAGIQFYLDDYIVDQLDKFNISIDGGGPVLTLKDGETINGPTEMIKKQRKIEELEQKLQELKEEKAE